MVLDPLHKVGLDPSDPTTDPNGRRRLPVIAHDVEGLGADAENLCDLSGGKKTRTHAISLMLLVGFCNCYEFHKGPLHDTRDHLEGTADSLDK